MSSILIKNARVVNEGSIVRSDVLVKDGIIARIDSKISDKADLEIRGEKKILIPGIIDDQVHFREPGLTHKADIKSESMAGIAGGITSFMDMPNVKPPSLTQELLEKRYAIAAKTSLANYSFYMGASNENLEEIKKTDPKTVCGIKVFMGSSTGNMLVDKQKMLEEIFMQAPTLVAVHCEDEKTIQSNLETARFKFKDKIPLELHPEIRSVQACMLSSSYAVDLAKQFGTRLHILHISTEEELDLFDNQLPLEQKKITAEVCVHHLWFDAADYSRFGNKIKCNPAIKETRHRMALLKGLLSDKLDIIATDHAPHTREEKLNPYLEAPSGIPLIQHSLNMMLEFYQQGIIRLEKIIEKMCHAPAICFGIKNRGFIKEGYAADLVLIDLEEKWKIDKSNILYKCNWSPLEGQNVKSKVTHTIVNGNLVYKNDTPGFSNAVFFDEQPGQRLLFNK